MERTYIMVKPDGVRRHLAGEIIKRFETRGFKLIAMKMVLPTREIAEKHYAVHKEKPFFKDLVDFITAGPVIAMVWEAEEAVRLSRVMIGATKPVDAVPGTIRGDLTTDLVNNLVHGSDAPDTAQTEIELWFDKSELVEW